MNKISPKLALCLLSVLSLSFPLASGTSAQPWQQNDAIFNPSGVPSVSFSQTRFADLDADGDLDLVSDSQLGDIKYYQNTGSATAPAWQPDHQRSIDHIPAGDFRIRVQLPQHLATCVYHHVVSFAGRNESFRDTGKMVYLK